MDKYGPLLGYVYLDPVGNLMVNEELLSQGYALLQTISPNYKYRQRFKELAKEAWQKKKGFWSACRIEGVKVIVHDLPPKSYVDGLL